ncbi:MAG: hypothetical protein JST63_17785 [Bacteroidetes bacterium]|nr:hypothetical protein [Bacteroidota bacterium]
MLQQHQIRRQRFFMLIALFALVCVIAKNLSACTSNIATKANATEVCCRSIGASIISLASEAEELHWIPLISFFNNNY